MSGVGVAVGSSPLALFGGPPVGGSRPLVTPGPRSAEQNTGASADLVTRSSVVRPALEAAAPALPPTAAAASGGTLGARCDKVSSYTLKALESAAEPECREWGKKDVNEFTSQYNQDAFLYYNFFRCMERPGTYVDVGAGGHPRKLSNTWFLDKCLGWAGVCAEPDKTAAEGLRANRTCLVVETAVSTFPGVGTVKTGAGGFSLTGVKSAEAMHKEAKAAEEEGKEAPPPIAAAPGEEVVPVVAVEDVLVAVDWAPSEESGRVVVDYMSVAVEDHEFEVLYGVPWDLVEVRFLTVDNVKNTLEVRELLNDQSYVHVQSVGMDDFYARLPLNKDLWRPHNLNWNRNAHAGIRKKYHASNSYLKEALYKGWDEFNKYVNKHLTLPQ